MATEVLPEAIKEVNSNTYIIRPNFQHKFQLAAAKETIHQLLTEYLHGKDYKGEECTDWCKDISNQIKNKLKELGYERYKFAVQVVIGEQKGVKMACRCFWESDTDNYAQDVFINDTLFCVAACFGVFFY